MLNQRHKTRHETVHVQGLDIFYRHAGDPRNPAVLLLHGYPNSSYTFRDIIGRLAESAYVVAPDLPGSGFSSAPSADAYDYTFASIADTIEGFLAALGLERFFLFVTDFGTPVGYHLATRRPDRVRGLIVQNGNVHDEGLGPDWDAPKAFFADPTETNRAELPEWMDFESVRHQYVGNQPDRLACLYPPEGWHLDWERLSRPGIIGIQFKIFSDYGSHIARFPAIRAYHREHQPPCLLLWGRRDPYFEIDEIMAYHRALEALEIHVFDSGHQLLETHAAECAAIVARFVLDVEREDCGSTASVRNR
jgi:pimeloyl-ACP methyl ester carboxylesterase